MLTRRFPENSRCAILFHSFTFFGKNERRARMKGNLSGRMPSVICRVHVTHLKSRHHFRYQHRYLRRPSIARGGLSKKQIAASAYNAERRAVNSPSKWGGGGGGGGRADVCPREMRAKIQRCLKCRRCLACVSRVPSSVGPELCKLVSAVERMRRGDSMERLNQCRGQEAEREREKRRRAESVT